ncbi:hypothetical protein BG846_04214 [Streptomyces fradiae ATCC 10745 = DSM 40063]|uniref:Uncharacterized protein n=1 Tax=Streptomyces fradiae ATCC 10745 = DSM 40063 TaxID=1319510 RepID=A0A1Y2NSW9_STRFR|nr:hypothetical protein BG846_04214 [Streptomyces fradiae ATCC 10745 = DSM 40063]
MKVCSNSNLIFSETSFSRTSLSRVAAEPPRSSSQLADQEIFMSLPVMRDLGRATGVCSPSGASVRVS